MKKEDKEKIKKISIRGRYAIGLICLERVLKELNLETKKTKHLINEMWQVTSSEKLGTWQSFLIENNPKVILGDYQIIKSGKITFEQAGFDTIGDENKLEEKYNLLKNLPNSVSEIINNLEEIANSNLFGGCGEYSSRTYNYTIELLKVVEKIPNVEIPEIEIFTFSKFTENHGWGNKFTKKQIR